MKKPSSSESPATQTPPDTHETEVIDGPPMCWGAPHEPVKVTAFPWPSTTLQKVGVAHDTAWGLSDPSTSSGADQLLPPSVEVTALPVASTDMQKLAVGHDTEAIPDVEAVSRVTADDQLPPL